MDILLQKLFHMNKFYQNKKYIKTDCWILIMNHYILLSEIIINTNIRILLHHWNEVMKKSLSINFPSILFTRYRHISKCNFKLTTVYCHFWNNVLIESLAFAFLFLQCSHQIRWSRSKSSNPLEKNFNNVVIKSVGVKFLQRCHHIIWSATLFSFSHATSTVISRIKAVWRIDRTSKKDG